MQIISLILYLLLIVQLFANKFYQDELARREIPPTFRLFQVASFVTLELPVRSQERHFRNLDLKF